METKPDNQTKMFFKHDFFEGEDWESAWVTKEGDYYKLDNILFYAKGYACGDLIKGVKRDGMLCADRVILESGHSTIQIIFFNENLVTKARGDLKTLGCESELSNMDTLISLDIPNNVSYKKILNFLQAGEKKEKWEFQEACISHLHKKELEAR
jgi:hypothetical protein